jgi:hypothetical protein
MVYLLDANVLITAQNVHYPIDVFPVFWDWLEHQIAQGSVRMPREIFDEIKDGSTDVEQDALYAWIQREDLKQTLVLNEDVDVEILQGVMTGSYSPANEVQLIGIGQDPFLVAYGKAAPDERCVVTYEVPAPFAAPHNRKIPDACVVTGVPCCDPMKMLRELGFTSSWQPP